MYIRALNGDFLSAQCPECLAQDAYCISATIDNDRSALMLFGICKKCEYRHSFSAPELNKKVIYLDQFCISGLGKLKIGTLEKNVERYTSLSQSIEPLTRQQLAIFPTSFFHRQETSYICKPNNLEGIQRIAELYSCGTRFIHTDSIVEIALMQELYSSGSAVPIDSILYGKRNCWYAPKFEVSSPIIQTSGNFRTEHTLKINNWFAKERGSFDAILNELVNEHSSLFLSLEVRKEFERKKISPSVVLKQIPIFRIIAALLESLKAKQVKDSMASDILMIAHILPYVDAIFVDKEMHGLLSKSNIPEEYKNRIYSFNGFDTKYDFKSFFAFLDSIKNNAPEYSYPPFTFNHHQLIQACHEQSDDPSPLARIHEFKRRVL